MAESSSLQCPISSATTASNVLPLINRKLLVWTARVTPLVSLISCAVLTS